MQASRDTTLRVWSVEEGTLQYVLGVHDGTGPCSCAKNFFGGVLNNPRCVISGGHTQRVECCAFSPCNRWIVSGSHDRRLILWDRSTGQEVRAHSGFRVWVLGLYVRVRIRL